MELTRFKTLRWTVPLAKALLLQSVVVSSSHAAAINNAPALPTSFNLKDTRSTQLDLDEDTSQTRGLDLYLDVTLNGASAGLTHFNYRDDQLWASIAVLQQLGFIVPPGTTDPAPLNSFANIKVDYNARMQSVTIIAPLSTLNLSTTVLNNRDSRRTQASASPGVLLNYNFYGSRSDNNSTNLSAFTELRAFNAKGVLSSTALTTGNRFSNKNANGNDNNRDWDSRTVRLDTSWSQSFPDKLMTVRAGDILTGALSWTRSTRLGGLQFGSNFDLQPYMTTTPLPSFFGSATLPSAVELYVNGLKQYSGEVPAGPFELNTAPSISGAGNAQLVLTDALGQSSTVNFSLYDTHRLLRPGLSDWSVELGTVRENYGTKSFDYGDDIAAFGTWRYGVNNRFTAETHAEATKGLANAGVGGTWVLGGSGGVLFASLAGSESQGQSGMQYSGSYSWNNNRFNIGLNTLGTSGDYRDVATQYGSTPIRQSNQISTGYSTQSLGSFGLSYNQVDYAEEDTAQFASAYWSKSFGRRLSINASYNHDINDSANNSASIGASFSLDRNISFNSSVQHTDDRNDFVADVSQSAPGAGGLGWRAQARHSIDSSIDNNNNSGGLAELNYLGRYGQVQAGLSSYDGNYSTFASGTGSLVMMGGGLFAARQINDGFAVVSTDGVADVPVLLQNNVIGTTNSRGLLLISPLNAYQENKIGIDPMDLPADLRIDKVALEATPTDRAGTLVNFKLTPVRSASIILTDSENQPIEIGSQVRLTTKKDAPSAIVGFDGEVYLDTLDEHNILEVSIPSGDICTVSFDYQKQGDDIPLIGPFTCQKVK
ncbi:fimbria/pilus outer membrane usher protein [Psychrobacter sp. DAB_AL62B]|uniref:fimbria/pilus outer membrane usher protein n=1 Tax=Psychrobacter sp. DAB_AL62B TaxID=1028420 RepID=UPI0023813CF1|nr:fimbria/pilus outer membrane usher protein [Psychrobacter sp. DAB_AL62B]MDE4455267.1 fimbrial biogenesis outer membrane usher protein [Psychrobacter sp. DAB_AL62B]